jgi:hypothetical protein
MTASRLPPEIISMIIASVPLKSTLYNIALCSSLFYALTVPILYTDVHVYSHNHHFKTLRPLTILFLTKPTLAQFVRQFTLRDAHERNDFPTTSNANWTGKVEGVLREAVFANSHSGKDFEEWIMRISGDHPDALLAILLPTMVRLEKLDLMLRSDYVYFDRILTRAIGKEKPFDKQPLYPVLKDFMHQASWEWYTSPRSGRSISRYQAIDSRYIILFQCFPQIRSIFGYNISESYEERLRISSEYPVVSCLGSSLTHLELKRSYITNQNLHAILEIPKALQTFIYEIIPQGRSNIPHFHIIPDDILFALEPQYDSLENLWIDGTDNIIPAHDEDKYSSLSKFTCLKSLRVAATVILEYLEPDECWFPHRQSFSGLFPETLETLQINFDAEGVLFWKPFVEFVLAEMYQVPRLSTIVIECSAKDKASPWWKELQEEAEDQGVDLFSVRSGEWSGPSTFLCERGWGMDGSIRWAPCHLDENWWPMPLVRDWVADWEITSSRGYEEEAKDFFYKWHLCHEGKFDEEVQNEITDEQTRGHEEPGFFDNQDDHEQPGFLYLETNDNQNDHESPDGQASEAYHDDHGDDGETDVRI